MSHVLHMEWILLPSRPTFLSCQHKTAPTDTTHLFGIGTDNS